MSTGQKLSGRQIPTTFNNTSDQVVRMDGETQISHETRLSTAANRLQTLTVSRA